LKQDQSFDGRADKFARNIYDSTKGRIRTTIVWSDIEACLARLGNRPLRILDAGGGFGYFAQKLAAMGHQVELCDLSAEMLDLAREQIAQKGLEDRIRLIHCPIQDLKHQVTGTFDLVLCHAVLEWLAEPRQTLLGLFPFVKAGGILSLLFYNRHGLLFQSLVVGNFDYVRLGLRGPAGHGAAILPPGALCFPGALHPCDGPETGRLSPTGVNTMRDPAAGAPPTPAYITTAGKDLPTITTR